MRKHMEERHLGEEEDFVAKVTHANKDCLTRQVREGVLIRRNVKEIMNSKTEYFSHHYTEFAVRLLITKHHCDDRDSYAGIPLKG